MFPTHPISRRNFFAYGIVLGLGVAPVVLPLTLVAAEVPTTNSSGSGAFISFQDGTLTIKGKSGLVNHKNVGKDFKTFQNNEDGPGCKPVDTVEALSRLVPGFAIRVNVEEHEITFGLDHRVIGTFVSYQGDKLNLLALEAPPGFLSKPTGNIALPLDPSTPVLESIAGGAYQFAGPAEKALKSVKLGTLVTARSEFDADKIEVIQIGESKRKIERYVGQSRGPVRGHFVSFRDGILQILGRGVRSLVANEYDRTFRARIAADIPVFESIDGGEYQLVGTAEALKNVKEGTIVTIQKVEEVVLAVQIGVAKQP